MRAYIVHLSWGAFAGVAACSTAPPTAAEAASSEEDATSAFYGVPAGIDVTRAYFHRFTSAQPTAAKPDAWLLFDLVANAHVAIELQAPATKAGRAGAVYGDLYRVTKGGGLAYVASIDGGSGDGKATFASKNGGSYVVDVYTGASDDAVQMDLTCLRKDGRCSPRPQPEDVCNGGAAPPCDDGLLCIPAARKGSSCPAPGAMGVCGLLADLGCASGPAHGVCGCDGADYPDACAAALAGIALKQRFPCSCDPSAWTLATGATTASVSGAYATSWVAAGTRKDVSVTFDPNAATYVETMTTGPDCSVKSAPCPTFPTQHFTASGAYAVAGGKITLTPDAASSGAPPTAFTFETSCTGAVVLRSHEDGATQDYDVPDEG